MASVTPRKHLVLNLRDFFLNSQEKGTCKLLHKNIYILFIFETKIDSSFPTAQFQIEGYTTYRLDSNANGGGILLYIWEDIPSTLLNSDMSIESFSIEINIRKKKAFSLHVQSK